MKPMIVDVYSSSARPTRPRRPREVRKRKVLAVRRELDEGRYAVNERLSVAFDRLIEDIMAAGDTQSGVYAKSSVRRRFR